MTIFQFIEQYCQDLVQAAKKKSQLVDLSEFPHDGFMEDIQGNCVPVIYIDGESIPISDILTMDKQDFCNVHKLPSAAEDYSNYISLLTIVEGEDALNRIRNSINSERQRLSEDVELVSAI